MSEADKQPAIEGPASKIWRIVALVWSGMRQFFFLLTHFPQPPDSGTYSEHSVW